MKNIKKIILLSGLAFIATGCCCFEDLCNPCCDPCPRPCEPKQAPKTCDTWCEPCDSGCY